MRNKERKKRRWGGYTMAEVLIVIAILGILAGLAIPAVITYRRDLKLTELDDNARTIYLAAQSNLSALRSAAGDALPLGDAVGRPAEDGAVIGATQFKYVSTDVPSTDPDWLVLPGSVDAALREAGSYYLVEFDPASGVVYGVFYTEDGDGKPLTEAVYSTISDPDKNCRVREGRNDFATASGGFLLGYYGADGELDLARPDAQTLPKPRLKLTNAEELVVDVTATSDSEVDLSRVFYSVSISDGTHVKAIVDKAVYNDGATNTVVLDTLDASGYAKVPEQAAYGGWTIGNSFAGWDTGITPGADVTVTVSVFYQPASGEGLAALPQSASVKTNSLFAARNGETVQVGYGRHLQNLGLTGVDATVTAAVQTRDIDFARTTPANDKDTRQHWAETYGGRKFNSISNAALKRFDGQERTIANLSTGGGLFGNITDMTLENVVLEDTTASGGAVGALASVAAKTTLTNCRVYLTEPYSAKPRLQGGMVGGLLGIANDVTIDGSFASTVISGGGSAGGLVGQANALTVRSSYAASHLSGGRVGGLVGNLTYQNGVVTIQNSYAAGCIATANVGAAGLVMPNNGATEETNHITIQNSYAAVDYGGELTPDKVYGVAQVGHCTNVSYLIKPGINDTVDLAGVTAFNDTQLMKARADLSLPATFIDGENTAVRARPYNLVERTETEGPLAGPLKAPYPYPTLRVSVNGETVSLPHYGDWLEAVAPPAPKSLIAYYEQFDGVTEYSCFINGAEQGTLDLTRTGAINADGYAFLSKERLNEDWEGKTDLTVTCVGMETRESTVRGRLLGTLDEAFNKTDDAAAIAYYVYAIPTTALDVIPGAGCYNEITVKGTGPQVQWDVPPVEVETTAWVNPLFGCAAYNGAKPGSAPAVIHIRSLRQLANVGRFFGARSYEQDLDIDAAIYYGDLAFDKSGNSLAHESRAVNDAGHVTVAGFEAWARNWDKSWDYVTNQWNMPADYRLIFTPIGAHGTPGDTATGYDTVTSFNGTYDGKGRSIRALSIRPYFYAGDSADYAGLFYRIIAGTLKDIHLSDCDVIGASGGSSNATGVLLARMSSASQVTGCTVENCAVTVQGTKAGGHAGGLIGYVDRGALTIRDCRVENCVVQGGEHSRNVGGMLGYVCDLKSGGLIENSQVRNVQVSNFFSKGKTNDSIEKRGSMGGFVGCYEGGSGVIQNCFVVGDGGLAFSGNTWNAGGFVGGLSKDAIQNCGVRLEGKVKTGYDTQRLTGGKYVGGFAGTIASGSVSASYAAIGVDGSTVGGFAGTLTGGSVSNCYAGGRTKSGKFVAASPNVAGTDNTGGLVGLWSSGTLDTCYSTCSVSGTLENKTDVFANTEAATINASVKGCYALGEAFVNNAKYGKLTKTKVATKIPELAEAERTETHPYDAALEGIGYPYAPVKAADGTAVPHYGDWPYENVGGGNREWKQDIPESEPEILKNLDAEAQWTDKELTLDILINVPGNGLDQDLHNAPGANLPNGDYQGVNGIYCITTDLGYKFIFRVNADGTIDSLAGDKLKVERVDLGIQSDGLRDIRWTISIPNEFIPPYVDHISFGSMISDDYTLSDIKNNNKGVDHLGDTETITIDGDFSDWLGYEHQVLESKPAGATTPVYGHTTGSILGTKEDIFFHLISDDNKYWVEPYEGMSFDRFYVLTGGEMHAWAKDGTELPCTWWNAFKTLTYHEGQNKYTITYNCPCMKTESNAWGTGQQWTTVPIDVAELYVHIDPETKHQEYEMRIDLRAWMAINLYENQLMDDLDMALEDGAEAAQNLDKVKWKWYGGTVELTATRDLTEKE